ncbi:MAG: DUF4910 domain-containing protein [Planctomycetota bacterium]
MLDFVRNLYAIKGRSITGRGLRATLDAIGRTVNGLGDWNRHTFRSGDALFDWTVPDEWTLRRATCITDDGRILADTRVHDLHVLNYSGPGRYTGTVGELADVGVVRSLADQPDVLPYLTSYYRPASAITLADNVVAVERETRVTVDIDTTLEPGVLDFAELVIPGRTDATVLLSAHCCHPQLANDNLASIAVLMELARHLAGRDRHFTYRFVFAPGTIGALAWLATHEEVTARVAAGLVLACGGDPGALTYKRSRRGSATGDGLMEHIVAGGQALVSGWESGTPRVRQFTPWDYDERQYNSPAFDLPIGRLTRTPNGEYDAYHTSRDNVDLVCDEGLADTLAALRRWVDGLEAQRPTPPAPTFGGTDGPLRTDGGGEPQLGKHGLYDAGVPMPAILWCLNLTDGHHTPAMMAERSGLSAEEVDAALGVLRERGLVR